jgi:hypothetical protein
MQGYFSKDAREYAWSEHSVQSEGYSLPAARVFSHLSDAGAYNEVFSGVTAYLALKTLALDYDKKEEHFEVKEDDQKEPEYTELDRATDENSELRHTIESLQISIATSTYDGDDATLEDIVTGLREENRLIKINYDEIRERRRMD